MANQYPIIYKHLKKYDAKQLESALEAAGYSADMSWCGDGSYWVYCWGLN